MTLASTLLSPSVALAEWVNVSKAKNGNHYDVEASSVRYSGNLAIYRTRIRLNYPSKNGAKIIGFLEVTDCGSGAYQELAQFELNSKGKLINSYEPGYDAPVEQTKVGSVQHGIYNFVCPGQTTATSPEENLRAYWNARQSSAQNIADLARSAAAMWGGW